MLIYEEAFDKIMAEAEPAGTTRINLHEAQGHILADEVRCPQDLPPFSNAAMDGYALRQADAANASESEPAALKIIGESAAGLPFDGRLGAGEAVTISTGAKVPEGADAVVMVERTERKSEGIVEVNIPVKEGEHIRLRGEDVAEGTVIARRGAVLDPGLLSLLSGSGVAELSVFAPRSVAILATGTELVPPGAPLGDGKIYESSTALLRAWMKFTPADVILFGRVEDNPEQIRDRLEEAMREADLLCICGGVSVGPHDHVKDLLKDLGVKEIFWKVKVKPGKPIFFGTFVKGPDPSRPDGVKKGWVFGIPGNPVSSLAAFTLFIEPFLRALHGVRDGLLSVTGKLTQPVTKKGSRRVFLTSRTFVDGGVLRVEPISGQGSGMLHSMAGANSFAVLPEDCTSLGAGEDG